MNHKGNAHREVRDTTHTPQTHTQTHIKAGVGVPAHMTDVPANKTHKHPVDYHAMKVTSTKLYVIKLNYYKVIRYKVILLQSYTF